MPTRETNGYGKITVQLARVEEQVKSMSGRLEAFIAAALSPEFGYVMRQEMMASQSLNASERRNIELRIDQINKDHNDRLHYLENKRESDDGVVNDVRRQIAYASGAAAVAAIVVSWLLHVLFK